MDEITGCLLRVSDNKFVSTTFVEITVNQRENDWIFDWSLPCKNGFKVFNLIADNKIQGRIALKPNSLWKAYEIDIVEAASNNRGSRNGLNKEYQGVGAHLFAEAARQSFQAGYNGYVSFVAKTQLIRYYMDSLGAIHIGGGRMVIETKAARRLVDNYYGSDANER